MDQAQSRPLAVVTGGSNGIGFALAQQFLSSGYDVMVAGEQDAHVKDAASRLSDAAPGGSVTPHASDLSREDGVDALLSAIKGLGRPVDVLCVNAGFGLGGRFDGTDLRRELQMIDLNVRGAVQLTKPVVQEMVARGSGKLLFTSSIAATMPDPFEAVYGATKAFLRWFGEALREELKDTGVGVTVLMPGVTDTNFFNRAEMMDTKAGASDSKDDPADVAKAAFEALMADKDKVLPLVKNKILGAVAGLLPDTVAAKAHRGLSEPGSASQ